MSSALERPQALVVMMHALQQLDGRNPASAAIQADDVRGRSETMTAMPSRLAGAMTPPLTVKPARRRAGAPLTAP